jgi:hypothetical protein
MRGESVKPISHVLQPPRHEPMVSQRINSKAVNAGNPDRMNQGSPSAIAPTQRSLASRLANMMKAREQRIIPANKDLRRISGKTRRTQPYRYLGDARLEHPCKRPRPVGLAQKSFAAVISSNPSATRRQVIGGGLFTLGRKRRPHTPTFETRPGGRIGPRYVRVALPLKMDPLGKLLWCATTSLAKPLATNRQVVSACFLAFRRKRGPHAPTFEARPRGRIGARHVRVALPLKIDPSLGELALRHGASRNRYGH